MARQKQASSLCDGTDTTDDDDLPLVLHKPSWQLRVCLVSVLITPLLYRLYLILVTIGYVLCSNKTGSCLCSSPKLDCPQVDLSWTGVFPCELGWRGSALAVAVLSVVFLVCYSLITACLLQWNTRKKLKQIVIHNPPVVNQHFCTEKGFKLQSTTRLLVTPSLNVYLLLLSFHLLMQSGDIESNPGPTEYEVMVTGGEKIVEALSRDPNGLALTLFTKGLISHAVFEETNELNQTKTDKAIRLYSAVLKVVQEYPHHYNNFIEVFRKKHGQYNSFLKFLQGLQVTPGGFKSQSVSSTVEAYKEYLKCTYNNKKLPGDDKWQCPLDCIKHFVNLKYIDIKSQLQRKEIEKSWDIIIKGSLDHYNLYKTTREQIDISRIACRIDDSLPNLVILNGDPGIGKTTLSWELCRRWSRGELWTEYSLVVLLQLRDENVQAATGIYDLFQFSDAGIPPSAETDVLSTHVQGAKILFILEGLDELPRKIREDKNSFLIKLIAGRVLPASTVVVTTRPWAVADLPSSCSSRLDQFIDILGFTQGQVREYISKMIADREAPAELQAFLDANPHISSAMCSPLLAHIVVNVYKQCFVREDAVFPNTTTELYTAYCRVLVERHLTDNPVEEEWNGELWNLPQSIQPRFNFLCEIAYQGITKEKQQLVFYKEDFPNAKATLGFMNSVHPLHQSATERVCPSYDFIHTTLQEFLAAIYIWKNHSPQKQLILFETACIDRRYKRILRFLAGLTKLGDPWTRCVLPVPTLMGASISTIKECEFSVESVMWLYESQNTELINEYEGVAMSAPLHCAGLKYYTALGHLIGTGNFQVLFQVFSTSSRSYEDFVDFTAINNLALALRKHKTCSSLLKRISLSSNALNNDSVNFLLQCIQPTASPGPVLCVMFSSKVSRKDAFTSDSSTKFIQSVEEIELFPQDYIRIKQTNYDLLSRLSEILKTKSNLKKLKLTCTKDLESKNRELSEIIMHSQSFQTLELRLPENKFTSSFYRQSWIKLGLKMLNLQCLRSRLLPSELFSVLDLNDKFSRQQSAVRSLQSLTRDLEYLEWDSFEVSDVDQLSSFFQTVFACSALERLTINEFSESTSQGHQLRDVSRLQLDGLSAHPSLQRVELAYFPGLGCLIFSSLQQNKSVKYLNITVDFEDDGITDVFGALLAHNKSLTAICLNAHSIYTCRNALVATLEHVSTATSLKGFSIKFSNHLFDDSISSAICKILKNVNIERLGIPLFLPPQKSFLEIFAKALCENSTLQILILRHSKYQPLAHVHPIPVDLPRTTVSGEEAEALGEMLKVNKSLEIIHLLAEFSDCSPLVRGLAVNNTIQEFQIDRSTKESAIKCPDYHLARKKMVFLCEAMLAMQNCQESRGVQYKRFF